MKTPQQTKLLLREMIRELAEEKIDRDELVQHVHDAIQLSYENPAQALARSKRDLRDYDRIERARRLQGVLLQNSKR